jgi:hypothetical protein
MTTELLPSDYVEDAELSFYGAKTLAEVEALRELTEVNLKLRLQDRILRVNERSDGLFDLIVLKRVN